MLPEHLVRLAARDMVFPSISTPSLPRHLGANFDMLATYVDWLRRTARHGLADVAAAGRRIVRGGQAVQFSARAHGQPPQFSNCGPAARADRIGL